jgi:hypothetical protein
MVGANVAGTSSATAGGRLDADAEEAAVAADGSSVTFLADVCCWGPDPSAGIVAGGGGASSEAKEGEALTGKGWVKTCRHKSYARKTLEESKLTWDHGPSSGPGSGAPAVIAAPVAPAAVAAAAPAVTAVGLMQVAVAVVSDPKVVVVEGSCPSARPGPEVWPP